MDDHAPPSDAILTLDKVSKNYGAVRALEEVSFTVRRGEIHAILGENGAGKSTTLKIINGEVEPDDGTIHLSGQRTNAAQRAKSDIAMVHQELAVFPNMSVAENIFVGHIPRQAGFIGFSRMQKRAMQLLQLFGLTFDPRAILGDLTSGQQQIVEILRAVESDASLLILDEPTSGLNKSETETLMGLIRKLRASGHTILYVSHRLSEVLEMADQITVLRDGKFIETLENKSISEEDLIRRMVGRNLALIKEEGRDVPVETPIALKISHMSLPGRFENMAIDVRQGEVVGVFGLEGSGAEEFSQALFGIVPPISGRLELHGQPIHDLSPAVLLHHGISYLHANRKQAGLYMERSIADNISAPILDRLSLFGLINRRRIEAQAKTDIERFAIRVPNHEGLPKQLSGGNQQKVMISAALAGKPEVIVLNEPTRGVDVAAKSEVHEAVLREAKEGHGVLVFSSDLPELLRLAHRIVVMRSGRKAGEVSGHGINEEAVMALAAGTIGVANIKDDVANIKKSETASQEKAEDKMQNTSSPFLKKGVA